MSHELAGKKFAELLDVMAQLRGANGCPWDKEQSHDSLRSFLLEECHELLDALEGGDSAKIREELGDLLHQIVFHCQIATEMGAFTAEEMIGDLRDKMVRRHPHVFSGESLPDADSVLKQWVKIKAAEKAGQSSLLGDLPKSMPALSFSTARSGDWVDRNVAQALGIKPEKAAMMKEKGVDLMAPQNREEDAVSIYYRNLVQYNVTNIAERFQSAENMPSFKEPISIVFSGGTAMAGNFIELVKDVFKKIEFPIPVKDIRLAKDPLHATAKGALVAAQLEMANQPQ